MAQEEIKDYYREKVREVAVHVGTVVADILLLAFWLIGEYCMEHFLVPRFSVDTFAARMTLGGFRILFPISTFIPCASKIRKHVIIMWMRDSADITSAKAKIDAAAAQGEDRE